MSRLLLSQQSAKNDNNRRDDFCLSKCEGFHKNPPGPMISVIYLKQAYSNGLFSFIFIVALQIYENKPFVLITNGFLSF